MSVWQKIVAWDDGFFEPWQLAVFLGSLALSVIAALSTLAWAITL